MEDLTLFLIIQLLEIIKIRSICHVLHVDWNGGRTISGMTELTSTVQVNMQLYFTPPDMLPVRSSEEGVCLHSLDILTKSLWNITQQSGEREGKGMRYEKRRERMELLFDERLSFVGCGRQFWRED